MDATSHTFKYRNTKPWTSTEDQYLKDHWLSTDDYTMGVKLQRSAQTVKTRRCKLGLHRDNTFQANPGGNNDAKYIPDPAAIAERAAYVRSNWSQEELFRRQQQAYPSRPVTPPYVDTYPPRRILKAHSNS